MSLEEALALAQEDQRAVSGTVKVASWGQQLLAVWNVMKDGRRRTLAEIAFLSGHPEASVSARLRDLRRKGHLVVVRKAREGGLREYALVVNVLAERPK